MKAPRRKLIRKENRCFECPHQWAAITIHEFGPIFRCMPCWVRYYLRSRSMGSGS